MANRTFYLDGKSISRLEALKKQNKQNRESASAILRDLIQLGSGPIVYTAYDRKGRPIYVGSSKHGISRPLSSNHHALSEAKLGGLECIAFDTIAEAMQVERERIRTMQPALNIAGTKNRPRRSGPKRLSFDLSLELCSSFKKYCLEKGVTIAAELNSLITQSLDSEDSEKEKH